MRVLVVNAGSSSLKLALLDDELVDHVDRVLDLDPVDILVFGSQTLSTCREP